VRKHFLLVPIFFMISKPSDGVPAPLRNMGNTCYINSIIQCMYNIDFITNFALFSYRIKPYKQGSLASFYVNLVHAIHNLPPRESSNYTAAQEGLWDNELTNFVNESWNRMGARWSQEDAPEFFAKLLDSLVEEDTRYRASTPVEERRTHPIGKTIKIETTDTIKCPQVQYRSTKKNVDLYLNIPASIYDSTGRLKELTTLGQCLDHYFVTEKLEEYAPEGYPLQRDCTKKIEITELSDIVVIMPKRFAFDPITFEEKKLDHDITIPLTKSFRKYYSLSSQTKTLYKYELIAAAHHGGGTGGGHYVAHVKDKKTSQWYYCSDSTIKTETQSEAQMGINQSYVFIYRKNKKITDMPPEKKRKPTRPAKDEGKLAQELQRLARSLNDLKSML